MKAGRSKALVAACLVAAATLPARAQSLPSEPIVLAGSRVTIGGELSATFACANGTAGRCGEDAGFFNDTDYEHSALRALRFDLSAAVKAGAHFSILGDVRAENGVGIRPYAFFLRIRPWIDRPFDIQVGRVPPTFGGFARRTYPTDNLLIGYPLAYQYLTSLRADAVPAGADELLGMRGRGWESSFSLGDAEPYPGVPLANGFRWDTGVQVHAAGDLAEAAASMTVGTPANPLFLDDNDGKQLAGRVVLRPFTGLVLGASAARGPFVGRAAARAAVGDGRASRFTQAAWGGDVEYSRAYYLVRFEAILSEWSMPDTQSPGGVLPLRAMSTSIEGRYKIRPGVYAAARHDHLGFSEVSGTLGPEAWDAPVTRIEIGGGYSIQRNLTLKLAYQRNTREGGPVEALDLTAVQLLFWF